MILDLVCIIVSLCARLTLNKRIIEFVYKKVLGRYLDFDKAIDPKPNYPVNVFTDEKAVEKVFINKVAS